MRFDTLRPLAWAAIAAASVGCTASSPKEYVYEALYQRHCLENVGMVDCDPRHESYESYQRKRDEAAKQ